MSVQFTAEEIRALGVRMHAVTACQIVYDVGRTRAYEMLRDGDHDLPVLRSGRKYVVPTSAVLRLLGLNGEPSVSSGAES